MSARTYEASRETRNPGDERAASQVPTDPREIALAHQRERTRMHASTAHLLLPLDIVGAVVDEADATRPSAPAEKATTFDRDAEHGNRITVIHYPDNTTRQFEYGPDGDIIGITERDGSHWTKGNNGHWTKDGSDETWDGTVKVDDKGNVIHIAKNGAVQVDNPSGQHLEVTTLPNGEVGTVKQNPDGSTVTRDDKGRVVQIDYPNDQGSKKFTYDEKGNLKTITETDGTVWTNQGDGTWKSDKGDVWKGSVRIDNATGNMIYTDEDGVRVLHTDHNEQAIEQDMTPYDGRVFSEDDGETSSYQIKPGDNLTRIAISAIRRAKKDPHYKPKQDEINREIDAIVDANPDSITDRNRIRPGKIRVPDYQPDDAA
jgi:YD repeat-containing protein